MGLEAEDDSAVIGRYMPFSIPACFQRIIVALWMLNQLLVILLIVTKQLLGWVAQLLVRMLDKEGEFAR